MTNAEFNELFRKRTKEFVVRLFHFLDSMTPSLSTKIIAYQCGKSGSSIGANFSAFTRGRSRKERFAKICIVVEEADESLYWLDILQDLSYGNKEEIQWLMKECEEILKICNSIKSTAGLNLK
jgi:four helix bundle protein